MATRWYVSCNGEVVGPVESAELVEWVRTRTGLSGSALYVRDEAASAWAPLEQSPFASMLGNARGPEGPSAIVQHVPVYYPQPAAPTYLPESVCVRCGANGRKVTKSRMTGSGSVTFWVCLFLCFPIALVALVAMREQYRVCQGCGSQG
jgi:hypothetical protein